MTELEFDVLDELYFVVKFEEIVKKLETEPEKIKQTLQELYNKNWIKVLESHDLEVKNVNLKEYCENYYFLASKLGLRQHNLR